MSRPMSPENQVVPPARRRKVTIASSESARSAARQVGHGANMALPKMSEISDIRVEVTERWPKGSFLSSSRINYELGGVVRRADTSYCVMTSRVCAILPDLNVHRCYLGAGSLSPAVPWERCQSFGSVRAGFRKCNPRRHPHDSRVKTSGACTCLKGVYKSR